MRNVWQSQARTLSLGVVSLGIPLDEADRRRKGELSTTFPLTWALTWPQVTCEKMAKVRNKTDFNYFKRSGG